jgi:hypothetical protein
MRWSSPPARPRRRIDTGAVTAAILCLAAQLLMTCSEVPTTALSAAGLDGGRGTDTCDGRRDRDTAVHETTHGVPERVLELFNRRGRRIVFRRGRRDRRDR